MIALIIVGVLLLCLTAILFLPTDAVIKFKDELFFKINFSGIRVWRLEKDKEVPSEPQKNEPKLKEKPQKENALLGYFKKLKAKHGFSGAVKLLLGFAHDLLPHIKGLLKHIKIKRVVLDITVAEGDAAKTAIEYGSICAVAYPLLAAFEAVADIRYKSINISSDFEKQTSEFAFECTARTRIFFLLIMLVKIYSEYKKFTARIENYERH